jgi:membrane protease YdiL (CAAX protease family)
VSPTQSEKKILWSTILLYVATTGAIIVAALLKRTELVPLILLTGAIAGSYLPMELPSLRHRQAIKSAMDGILASIFILVPYIGLLYLLRELSVFEFKATLPPNVWKVIGVQLVVVALPEEFFFRATVQAGFDTVFKPRWKILGIEFGWGLFLASLLFGLAHVFYQGPFGLTTAIPALVFGLLYTRRQNVMGAVIFHTACNLVMTCFPAFNHTSFS